MIHFLRVRYKNLLSSGNAFIEIELDKHSSTLIVGENGAGKSTILEALSFGLYGKPFRKVNKGQLINSINGKGLLVEVEFQINKRMYKVVRGQKPNVFEIYQDGELINQHAESKEYQEHLEKHILKVNHKSFSQIVILGNASFTPFMQLSAAHRREIIEDLLDIEIFSTMNSLLKDKIATNKTDTQTVDYNIRSVGEQIELHKKHVDSLKQNNDELIKQKQEQLEKINNDINTSNIKVGEINDEIEKLSLSIEDSDKVQKKLEKIQELARKVDNRLDKIKKDISFFETHDDCPTCRQGIQHDHKATILEKNASQALEIEEGKTQLASELDAINNRLTEITKVSTTISNKNREVSDILVQIRTWTSFVTQINNEIASINNNTKHIDANNEEIKLLKQVLKTSIAKKEDLLKERQTQEIASSFLKDSGIKTKIIKQYIPVMNKLINKYLAAMDFFVNFELNENFEEKIKSRFRDEFTYESFSEGEKMRIDLSLLFTWRAIAKLRNSASTNLLIMDEVFDSSLDNSGTDEFLKIINGLVGDSNVFIISHKGDQLFDKFNHTIRFEKHKNFSRIVG